MWGYQSGENCRFLTADGAAMVADEPSTAAGELLHAPGSLSANATTAVSLMHACTAADTHCKPCTHGLTI
jgi:hypothetical protein